MKKRALLKILAAPEDLESLRGVFEHLRGNGVKVSEESTGLGKKDMVLAVLSDRFYADEELKSKLFDLLAAGAENILPLNLADKPVPEDIMNLLFARNIIMPSGRSDEQLAERILSAIPEKKNYMTAILSVAVAVILLVSGLFLWRSMRPGDTEAVMAAEEPIPNPLGITEEELAEIKDVVIVGDYFGYFTYDGYDQYGHWPIVQDFAYEVVEADGSHWYSVEDGREYTMTRYDDLRFLELMPNLNAVSMVLVDVDPDMLPDLSGAEKLTDVIIRNCSMEEISWISGSTVSNVDISGTDIADFSPLSDCKTLYHVSIDGQGEYTGDFSGFSPPAVTELNLNGMAVGEELAALSECHNILRLRLSDLQIENLDFLKDMTQLQELDMHELHQLKDISALAGLTNLRSLQITGSDGVRDYTSINSCKNLERIHLDRRDWMPVDSGFLMGLNKLNDIGLFGLNLNNLEFLATVNQSYGLCMSFAGDIQDYSGLSYIKRYQWLHVNPRTDGSRYGDYSLVGPHIQDASIAEMELYFCRNVDLAELPKVENRLVITGGMLEDLSGLNASFIKCLELKDMQYLRSLKGIENLPRLETGIMELNIMGCIRLRDYSALDGAKLRLLQMCGMENLPDFSKFTLSTLQLESIEDMEDLSCLETLDKDGTYNFSFPGLEDLKDLSALRQFKGTNLSVPPQVADQAEELVKDGNFRYCEVTYPNSGWFPMNEEVILLNMEELETLPRSALRRVSRVWIAGDQIVDPNRYEVREEWEYDHPVSVLYDRETGKNKKLVSGNIHDFSRLSELTNLWELRLFVQPITSLEGIQNLSNLRVFEAMGCTNLHDVSALYTLQNLEDISFQQTPVDSIQGVQNLPRLRGLNVASTYVTDLSPLLECDFSYAEQDGGFCLVTSNSSIADLSPISVIPGYGHLNLCGYHPELWMHYVENAFIRGYCGPMGDDETLRQFVERYPELEEMHIEAGYQLTDLTPLLELENLRYVHIWDGADLAARSLEGQARNFQLDVD